MGKKSHVAFSLHYSSEGQSQDVFTPGVNVRSSEQRKQKPKCWLCPRVRDLELKARTVASTYSPEDRGYCRLGWQLYLQCLEHSLPWTRCSISCWKLDPLAASSLVRSQTAGPGLTKQAPSPCNKLATTAVFGRWCFSWRNWSARLCLGLTRWLTRAIFQHILNILRESVFWVHAVRTWPQTRVENATFQEAPAACQPPLAITPA